MKTPLSVLIVVLCLLAACASSPTPIPTEPPPTNAPAAAPVSLSDVVGITWQWAELTETEPAGQSVVADPENYTLALMREGTANVRSDCNRVSWPYTMEGNVLTFDALFATTLAMCPPGSLYDEYLKLLGNGGIVSLENGRLVLELNSDAGRMVFANGGPAPEVPGEGGAAADIATEVAGIAWQWVELTETEPAGQSVMADPENYTLALMPDGTANVKADCNRVSWPYTLEGNVLTFDALFATTLAMCPPGSLYDEYLKLLGNGGTVALENGRLVLELENNAGRMVFEDGGPTEAAGEGSQPAAVTGSVVAEGNPSLPPGAMLEVRVEDVSLADAPATQVGSQVQEISSFPADFEAAYDPQLVDTRHTYGLTVRVTDAAGSLLYINTQASNVLTQGNPTHDVEVRVEPVGVSPSSGGELIGKWQWQRSAYNDDTELVVDDPSRYAVEFRADGTLGIQADCNQLSWTYTRDGNSLTINDFGPTTLAMCPPSSLDQQFLQDLSEVLAFVMHEGNLVLNLMADGGNMIFGE